MAFLDFLFPKYCVGCRKIGSYICDKCFSYISFNEISTCVVCQRSAMGGTTHPYCKTRYSIDGVISSLVYQGIVKKLVYQFKYKPHVKDLRSVLDELFYEGLIQKELFYALASDSVLVPIPLYKTKLRRRGYNQSQVLAEGLAKRSGIPITAGLERVRNTQTQVGLPKEKRAENIKDAFAVKDALQGVTQVLLIDDIVTSGATLAEAARVLKKAGVKKVWGVTLAHGR